MLHNGAWKYRAILLMKGYPTIHSQMLKTSLNVTAIKSYGKRKLFP
ncbi:hypothetical protein EVA_07643 [gut metagenome]|uniref:Uncharacterized protein n=1 Tax=gut metagenome TaxID=749906 RepID=J9CVJ5_9ZZZZ